MVQYSNIHYYFAGCLNQNNMCNKTSRNFTEQKSRKTAYFASGWFGVVNFSFIVMDVCPLPCN